MTTPRQCDDELSERLERFLDMNSSSQPSKDDDDSITSSTEDCSYTENCTAHDNESNLLHEYLPQESSSLKRDKDRTDRVESFLLEDRERPIREAIKTHRSLPSRLSTNPRSSPESRGVRRSFGSSDLSQLFDDSPPTTRNFSSKDAAEAQYTIDEQKASFVRPSLRRHDGFSASPIPKYKASDD